MKTVSFIIPCYNSEKTISLVVDEIKQTIASRGGYDYEIVLVNDKSPDNTFLKIKQLCENDTKIKGINLSKNFGQHGAIMAGLNNSCGDIFVCLDDDGQTPANEVFGLIDTLGDDCDVAMAKYHNKKHSLFKNFGSRINDLMAWYLIGKPKNLYLSSYFVCKKFVRDEIIKYNNPYPYMQGLLLRSTAKIKNVNINHRAREIGTSNYSFKKMLSLWLNGFTSFSIKPLRIATLVGGVVAVLGFMFGIYIIIRRLVLSGSLPTSADGWSSLMSVLLFTNGLLMLMLGLLGEYLGRMFISVNDSPQYVIAESSNLNI